jgi:hypothetical protein
MPGVRLLACVGRTNEMKTLKATVLSALSICLSLALFLSSAPLSVQSAESFQWGAPVGGLQMSISASGSRNIDVPEFQVALRNIGDRDVMLNLGSMLANGKVQLPRRIGLTLTDAGGRTRELHFFDKRYPAIVGRVDDYVVPLRVGSTYILTLNLDQFWSPETKEFQLQIPPGKNLITAQFEGSGARSSNLDTPGMRLMNIWEGKLQSNALAVER